MLARLPSTFDLFPVRPFPRPLRVNLGVGQSALSHASTRMVPTFAEAFDAPLRAWIQLLEYVLEKRAGHKAAKKAKQKAAKTERRSRNQESCLDEGVAEMIGHGLGASNDCRLEEDDPRFEGNPHGEGSYKTFEVLSAKSRSTTECNTTPNSSPRISGSTRVPSTTGDVNSVPLLNRSVSVDWKPEKGKGRAAEGRNDGCSAAKDYQGHLDRTSTRADLLRRGKVFVIMKRRFR